MAASDLFPTFLKLDGRRVLVVGGGPVAAAKVESLRATGAAITVVAPEITPEFRSAGLTIHRRRFRPSDLNRAWLVVAAATPPVNRAVARAARARHLFVNAVDDPANASAYLGGVVRRHGVTIAISTGGRAPALVGLLRERLAALLPADLATWVQTADALRAEWRRRGTPMPARRPALLDAIGSLSLVSLVGAGPGDPDLLTRRAISRLEDADVVFYDGLVPDDIVSLAGNAERISVARRAGTKSLSQSAVSSAIVTAARQGRRVVRLKAGDPFVLGRGGEEADALVAAGIPFEIVPGVSSATAAPALAGIPITKRGVASSFVVVSGHAESAYAPILDVLPPCSATVVVLMGLAARLPLQARLLRAGWPSTTPVAIVTNASQPTQLICTGTLTQLPTLAASADRHAAGVIVIGDVVAHAVAPRRARASVA